MWLSAVLAETTFTHCIGIGPRQLYLIVSVNSRGRKGLVEIANRGRPWRMQTREEVLKD
jgi:hypothetical protein